MGLLSKEAILESPDVRTQDVDVPEWGGTVRVRGLTGVGRDQWEASIMVRRGKQMVADTHNARAKLLAQCMIDEAGEPLFSPADVTRLGEKSGSAIEKVYDVAAKLSGITEADFEEAVQDFTTTPGEPTSSG